MAEFTGLGDKGNVGLQVDVLSPKCSKNNTTTLLCLSFFNTSLKMAKKS
jgi:hypothetical protein